VLNSNISKWQGTARAARASFAIRARSQLLCQAGVGGGVACVVERPAAAADDEADGAAGDVVLGRHGRELEAGDGNRVVDVHCAWHEAGALECKRPEAGRADERAWPKRS
jgi:hypothetical protein